MINTIIVHKNQVINQQFKILIYIEYKYTVFFLLIIAMGNKLCCAARGGLEDGELDQFTQDGIEVFTEAITERDDGDDEDDIEEIEIFTKMQLEKKFTTRHRKHPHDIDNLATYGLFLIIIRGEKDAIRAEKILRSAEKLIERERLDGCLTYSVFALYYWILKQDNENAEKYFNKALASAGDNEMTKAHLLSDHALFLESLGDKDVESNEQYINARELSPNVIDPVNLCNLAIQTYRTEPHDFTFASRRFHIALDAVNNKKWKSQGRGNFVQQSYNIFIAAYSVKIAAMAVHDDHQWEHKYHAIFDKNHIHTFHDFFDFDISLRPISVVVQQNLHLYTHFADEPKQLEIIEEIADAVREHAKEHPQDFRSRWRYAMILCHCQEDIKGASDEFKQMVEECDPPPSYNAFLDAALFFQNDVDVNLAEKFFEKAIDAGGHANGHCLALTAMFYHDIKVDRVKSIRWAENAVHLDPSMKDFLLERGLGVNLDDAL